ncbi:MAG: hypothetical protein ACREJO_18155, partial [Phycisphaerales bacterium]
MPKDEDVEAGDQDGGGSQEPEQCPDFTPWPGLIEGGDPRASQPPSQPDAGSGDQQAGDKPDELVGVQREANRIQRRIAFVGFWLFVVTLVSNVALYCVSNRNAEAAKTSADAAKGALDLARIEQRAYVVFESIDHSDPQVGQILAPSVTFKNVGNTPALNLRTAIAHIPPDAAKPCPPFDDPQFAVNATPGNLGPGVSRSSPMRSIVVDGQARRIEMYARYSDMFGVLH